MPSSNSNKVDLNLNLSKISINKGPFPNGLVLKEDNETVGLTKQDELNYKYPQYLPVWKIGQTLKNPTFNHIDKGLKANPLFPNLFPANEDFKHEKLSHNFGSDITGIQLSKLSNDGKDELALFIAQRGVAVFRNQDFKDLSVDEAIKFGNYFGPGHIHPAGGSPKNHPEIGVVHDVNVSKQPLIKLNTNHWHSDISFEPQPAGTTFLIHLQGPTDGGDTVFSDSQGAYDRLSDNYKKTLEGLKVRHSGDGFKKLAEHNLPLRNEIPNSFHPLIRTHPVTKKKSIYVNRVFSREIVGFKDEESSNVLNFLYGILENSLDLQVRIKWEPGSVVVWDNRRTLHSVVLNYNYLDEKRHLFRLTPMAEPPTEEFSESLNEHENENAD